MANRAGLKASIFELSQRPIVQGGDAFIIAQARYIGDGCEPYEFQNFVGATGFFENTVCEEVSVSGSLESVDRGLIRFTLPAEFTQELAVGEEQSMEVAFRDDRGLTILPITGKIAIAARFLDGTDPCPCP